MNPLDWTGPEFLLLYVPLLVAGYLVARRVGRPRRSTENPLLQGKRLEPYEVALLNGVEPFHNAVIASLVHRGVLHAEGDRLVPSAKPPAHLTSLESKVLRATKGQPVGLFGLGSIIAEEERQLRERLIRKGLLVSRQEAHASRFVRVLVFGAVLALGVLKLLVGLLRERPVGLLFALLVLGFFAAWTLATLKAGRTPLGDRTLKALQAEHQALRTTVSSEGSARTLSGAELALAVALFGTTALAAPALASLRQHPYFVGGVDSVNGHTPDFGSASVSSGSSCSGSGGGDSGGSDSGGGGGGGCGGCGGGGGGGSSD